VTCADEAERPVLFEATVRTPVAPMHSEGRIASPMISQQLAGHRVVVLDEDGDWYEARGDDGYDGWMHRGFLAHAPDRSARQSRYLTRVSLGCVAGTADGDRALPLRAILSPEEVVRTGEVAPSNELQARFPLDAAAITRSARHYFRGTSYLWGGVTPWGADCSGLVQSVFALHGMMVPRDAWQQAELGRDAGRAIDALHEGDLMFFSDRADQRITHVGIALGDRGMVHLALGRGGFAVEHLGDEHDAYVSRLRSRFMFARRLL
jgi:gamma-D-glutamyl-L-lysine dipeptidyl-peptidase